MTGRKEAGVDSIGLFRRVRSFRVLSGFRFRCGLRPFGGLPLGLLFHTDDLASVLKYDEEEHYEDDQQDGQKKNYVYAHVCLLASIRIAIRKVRWDSIRPAP